MYEAVRFANWLHRNGWKVRGGIGSDFIWVIPVEEWGAEKEKLTTTKLYERFKETE